MKTLQKTIQLKPYPRGFHLITDKVEEEFKAIQTIETGMLNIFIQHTSAALSINENADPTVRKDFETFINDLVPESYPRFVHTLEGSDDMPAHVKASFFGTSLQIPISGGKLLLGIWQGIYLCEFRNKGGSRHLVLTAWGE